MDLSLDPEHEALADAARVAFERGERAPRTAGAVTELVVVARELGRAAVPSRFHTEVVATLLGWDGSLPVAVALSVHDGVADHVAHAGDAEVFMVRTATDRIAQVARDGVELVPQPGIGDDDRCRASFAALPEGHTCDVDAAIARAAVVRAADAVGAAGAALDAAVAHVRTREQWGQPLGVLQAVQHRCADMLIDVTQASDAVFDAAATIDRGADRDEVVLAAAYAQATAVERCRRVTAAAHQLAGGQGIHADAPFHRWYRRAKLAEPELGDLRSYRETIATSLLGSPGAAR